MNQLITTGLKLLSAAALLYVCMLFAGFLRFIIQPTALFFFIPGAILIVIGVFQYAYTIFKSKRGSN